MPNSNTEDRVGIAKLKTHLGRYLRKVKAGEEVIILDRQQSVAKLVPFQDSEKGPEERAPSHSWTDALSTLRARDQETPPSKLKKSSLSYLLEDREK